MRVSNEWMTLVGASAIDPLFETWLIMFEFSVDSYVVSWCSYSMLMRFLVSWVT